MTEPAQQLTDYLIATLSADAALAPLAAAGAIREDADLADPAQGAVGIVVGCADRGDADPELPGRLLITVDAQVDLRDTLADDPDLTHFKAWARALRGVLDQLPLDHELDGWAIRYISPWRAAHLQLDAQRRYRSFTASFTLQDITED